MAASVSVSVEVTLVSSGTSDQRFIMLIITCITNAVKAEVKITVGVTNMAILTIYITDSEMKILMIMS